MGRFAISDEDRFGSLIGDAAESVLCLGEAEAVLAFVAVAATDLPVVGTLSRTPTVAFSYFSIFACFLDLFVNRPDQ